jgi:hypothetical protein
MSLEVEGRPIKRQPKADQEQKLINQRHCERRCKKSTGYAYISMVGWMDRREKTRRCADQLHASTLGAVDKAPK